MIYFLRENGCGVKQILRRRTLHAVTQVLLLSWVVVALVGCEQASEQTASVDKEPVRYALVYLASEHGRIEGPARQSLSPGEQGAPVSAVPVPGYQFNGWSDGLAEPHRSDRGGTEAFEVQALFAPQQHTLIYSAGDHGTIRGPVEQQVEHGQNASKVTAVADEHYHFNSWSDGLETAERVDRVVQQDLQVTAQFAIDTYQLLYRALDHGHIAGPTEQQVEHGADGAPVRAAPDQGYHFSGWSDGLDAAERVDRAIQSDFQVNAGFARNQYQLEYRANEGGRIAGLGQQTVPHGSDAAEVTAVAAEHHHFVSWSDGVPTVTRIDQKVSGPLAVEANFAVDQYELTYRVGPLGTLAGPAEQTVAHGSDAQAVTAVAEPGHHFVSWSDGVATARRLDQRVSGPLAVEANFAVDQYQLTYRAGPQGTLVGPAEQTVAHGSDAQAVTAVADPDYHFVSWSDGVSTATRVDQRVKGAFEVMAQFAVNTYPIGGRVDGLVEGTELVLVDIQGDSLVVSANGNFRFPGEYPKGTAYAVKVQRQPSTPNQECRIENAAGTVGAGPVEDILIGCTLKTYQLGGQLNGLPPGTRVVLTNNGQDEVTLASDGVFTFSRAVKDGSDYAVTIKALPDKQNWTCTLDNGVGTVYGQDITDLLVDCFPQVVLQARAGIRRVDLDWNTADFVDRRTSFQLCRATEPIKIEDFQSCATLQGGVMTEGPESPYRISGLVNDRTYWFQLGALYPDGRITLSPVLQATPFGGLNDTGIDWCADAVQNKAANSRRAEKVQACMEQQAAFPGQDGMLGRDAAARGRTLEKIGRGTAGFDFSKICNNGDLAGEGDCPPNPRLGDASDSWACTRDNVTGLIWEVKSSAGLRAQDHLYSWYNPDKQVNGGDPGMRNGGTCQDEPCDTLGYQETINQQRLCGISTWRLPTRKELLSIIDNSVYRPAIDQRHFPRTVADYYWTSTPYAERADSAWRVYFLYGESYPDEKSKALHVRLVSGKTRTFEVGAHETEPIAPNSNDPRASRPMGLE